MNNLRKAYIKGLVKEAAGLSDIKNKLMEFYRNNKEVINRVGIDAAGGLGLMGLGKATDMLTGTKTTGRSHLLRLLLGAGLAEAGQYGYKKYTGLKNDLKDTETKLDETEKARATDAVNATKKLQAMKENHAQELAKIQNNLNARIADNAKLVAANAQLRGQLENAKAATEQAVIDTRNRASERAAENEILDAQKEVAAEQGKADSKLAFRENLAEEVKNSPSNAAEGLGKALLDLSKRLKP